MPSTKPLTTTISKPLGRPSGRMTARLPSEQSLPEMNLCQSPSVGRMLKVAIEGLWIGIGTKGAKWGRDDVLKDFWIRYKGSKIEASAIGYNCYKGSFPGETHLYLVKEAKDGWKIHELDSSTENNLGIFGFHKGKPRLKEAGRFFTTRCRQSPSPISPIIWVHTVAKNCPFLCSP